MTSPMVCYHVPSGFVPEGTAQDVLDYELTELDNDLALFELRCMSLEDMPASKVKWVWQSLNDALEWAADHDAPVVEFYYIGKTVTIARDNFGGILMYFYDRDKPFYSVKVRR